MIDPVIVVVLMIGAAGGATLGILAAGLMRSASRPIYSITPQDITAAYLMGWQDGHDGDPADTTRPVELYDWPAAINDARQHGGNPT